MRQNTKKQNSKKGNNFLSSLFGKRKKAMDDNPKNASTAEESQKGYTEEEEIKKIEKLVSVVFPLHAQWFIRWLIASGIFAFLSMLRIGWSTKEGWSTNFQVSNTTIIIFSLAWLPSLMRMVSILGISLKTPIVEAAIPGFTDLGYYLGLAIAQQSREVNKITSPEVKQEAEKQLEQVQKAYIDVLSTSPVEEINRLSEEYKFVRQYMQMGNERTLKMESLVARLHTLAPQANLSEDDVEYYLNSNDEGKRLAGLALVEARQDVNPFDQVLNIIKTPKSAFEQYHALLAMDKIPLLTQNDKDRLKAVLSEARRDFEDTSHFSPGTGRWDLSQKLWDRLN